MVLSRLHFNARICFVCFGDAKEKDVEYKNKEVAKLDKAVSEATTDRTGLQTELDAVNEYLKQLAAVWAMLEMSRVENIRGGIDKHVPPIGVVAVDSVGAAKFFLQWGIKTNHPFSKRLKQSTSDARHSIKRISESTDACH